MLTLSGATEFTALGEQAILPAEQRLTGEREVAFPTRSDTLTPVTFNAMTLEVPRMSLFAAPEVSVAGFRMFGMENRWANEESLVSDPALMTMYMNRKLEMGQRENLAEPFPPETDEPAQHTVDIGGEILIASSDEPSNYGSWMFRILPKILLGTDARHVAGIFVYSPQAWMKAVLETTRFGGQFVHHEPTQTYRIRNAVIPSLPAPQAYLRPEVRGALWSLHERAPSTASLGDKLYVSRRSQALRRHGFRVLENETAVVERLVERGFVEFTPEDHSFRDQLAIFDRARVIVGAGGSNMFGCLFARHAEFIVDLESCDDWVFAHRNVLASTDASFSIVRGVQTGRGNPWHRNWIIDADGLLDGLATLGLA